MGNFRDFISMDIEFKIVKIPIDFLRFKGGDLYENDVSTKSSTTKERTRFQKKNEE